MTKRWVVWLVTILVSLVVLVLIAGAAFRLGMAYNGAGGMPVRDGGWHMMPFDRDFPGMVGWHAWGFPLGVFRLISFPLLFCLGPLLLIMVFGAFVRLAFGRSRRHGWYGHRHWDEHDVPSHVAEWHRKLHENEAAGSPPPPPDQPAE